MQRGTSSDDRKKGSVSAHYSKFYLNTYAGTPYFQAHLPPDYPIFLVLQKARAFRRLPKNIKLLAGLAKQWAALHSDDEDDPNGSADWYDANNNELDPSTGKRLTDKEIDEHWQGSGAVLGTVLDIPTPPGGFADPDEWEPPPEPVAERRRPSDAQLLSDIASHGRARTAEEYGIPESDLP